MSLVFVSACTSRLHKKGIFCPVQQIAVESVVVMQWLIITLSV